MLNTTATNPNEILAVLTKAAFIKANFLASSRSTYPSQNGIDIAKFIDFAQNRRHRHRKPFTR